MVKRIGVAYLHSLVKSFEEEDHEWFRVVLSPEPLDIAKFFVSFVESNIFTGDPEKLLDVVGDGKGGAVLRFPVSIELPVAAVDKLRDALQQAHPKEVERLDAIFKQVTEDRKVS